MERKIYCSVLDEDIVLSYDGERFELDCSETYILERKLVDFIKELLLCTMLCGDCEHRESCMKDFAKEVKCREA